MSVFYAPVEFVRYRVVAASSPGIAAQYPPYSEDEAFDGAVLAEGLEAVLGTCRGEPAACRLQGGDAHLIESDEQDERIAQGLLKHFHLFQLFFLQFC